MNTQQNMEAMEDIGQKAEKGYGKFQEKISKVQDEFETLSSNARRRAEDAMENTVDLIRQNPLPALGIALLIGACLGALITAWSSRDDE